MPAAASPLGREDVAVVVGKGCAAPGASAVVGSGDVPAWLVWLASTAGDVWSTADSAAPGAVNRGAGSDEASADGGRAAVNNVSELVGATGGGAAAASCTDSEGTAAAAGLLTATGRCGTATACWDCAGAAASGGAGADGIGAALIVPMAEETVACVVVGAAAGGSIAGDDGGGAAAKDDGDRGGASAALVCAGGASCAVVDVVTCGGSAAVVSWVVKTEVAAVLARERVHRRPLTVVIDSCGEAMQTTGSIKQTPGRAQKRKTERKKSKRRGRFEHINLGN